MRVLCLLLMSICVLQQVPGCFPECIILGSVANCIAQRLNSVPALLHGITHLYLEMNYIGEINSTSMTGLEQLQELDLGRQLVPLVIRNNSFRRQSHLKKLVLDSNLGLQLEPQAFAGLSALQKLYLGYCSLDESILKGNVLTALSSLETLDLFGNHIQELQPSKLFANMSNLKDLNLRLNRIEKICESDLAGFQGKHFHVLDLNSGLHPKAMSDETDWESCGNPFREMSFQTLDLSNNGLSLASLKRFFRAIEGTKISHLKLSGHIGKGLSFDNLLDPDHTMFGGLKNSSLLVLDLSKNRISALQQGLFRSLKEVISIDISQNRVNQIHRNAFEGLQGHLHTLILSHNLLGEIWSYSFNSLTNLHVLDLSYNHIGVFGYQSFSGLPNLKTLHLTGNALRDLGFPASLTRLNTLLLNDNRLTSSSVLRVTRFAPNVTHLDIKDNRLTDMRDVHRFSTQLKGLQHLSVGGNPIRWCTQRLTIGMNHLQALDLHSSSLQLLWSQGKCLNLLDNLGHVKVLNMSSNALQSLPRGVFKGLASVIVMDLSFNTLTYLQPDMLPKSLKVLDLSNNFIASPDPTAFQSLSYLNLKMNRFHCDTNMKSFLSWLKQTNVTFLTPIHDLRCEFPAALHNTPLLHYSAQVTQQIKSKEIFTLLETHEGNYPHKLPNPLKFTEHVHNE